MKTAWLRSSSWLFFLSLAFALVISGADYADAYSVQGQVQDMSSLPIPMQPIPGATVTVKDSAKTQVIGTQTSDASGNYSISLPAAGQYWVSATKTGFVQPSDMPVIVGNLPPILLPDATVNVILEEASGISLTVGWNFVSLPKLPPDTTITEVLSSVLQGVRIVWTYDNFAKQWLRYKPSAPDNTLSTLVPGKGYWIYMAETGAIDTSGWMPLGTHSAHLYPGWNLFGYNGTNNSPVSTALSTISGKWYSIWTWQQGQWFATSAATSGLGLPPLSSLERGAAYWIKGTADGGWYQSGDMSGILEALGSTPADNTKQVSPGSSIQLQMWTDLDPTTVNSSTVSLLGKGEYGVSVATGSISYDAFQNIITFLPQRGLGPGLDYTLSVKGALKDGRGNALDGDYSLSFSTLSNQLKKYVYYNSDGTVAGYGTYEFDVVGGPAKHVDYIGAGPDGQWFTSDDVISYYETYVAVLGRILSKTRFDDPGDDGVWFTSDDNESTTGAAYTFDYTPANLYRKLQSSYGDLTLEYTYNTNGFLVQVAFGDTTGTGADRYLSYHTVSYDAKGVKTRETFYNAPGPDNLWFTGDDVVEHYVAYVYDTNGFLTQAVTYRGPGPNGTWFNADDEASSCWKYTYNANGLLARADYYGDPGPDGKMPTADDVLFKYTVYSYDTAQRKTQSVLYGSPGPDRVLSTPDDVPSAVYDYDTTW